MRVIFMGKNKPTVLRALEYLVDKGVDVVAVVVPEKHRQGVHVGELARRLGVPITTDTELYQILSGAQPSDSVEFTLKDIDFVISFLFWKLIRKPLIELPTYGCINFHPGPLPEYRGWGTYNFGVLNECAEWGTTAHFVDESFDTGDIIRVKRFDISPNSETAFSLERQAQASLLALFKEVVSEAMLNKTLPRTPQSKGSEYSREITEAMRMVRQGDSEEEIQRKIRAFWFPPYSAATVEISGKEYYLLNDEMLREIGRLEMGLTHKSTQAD